MKKVNLKKLAIAAGVAAAIAAPASQAQIKDHVFFRIHGVVIVWGADSATGTTPVVSDFVLMNSGTGNAGNDIISTDAFAVVTGSLTAAPATNSAEGSLMSFTNAGGAAIDDSAGSVAGFLDASDTLSAFDLASNTDVNVDSNSVTHSFYVASNTAFDIKADTTLDTNSTGDIASLGLGGIGYALAVVVSGDDGLAFGGNAQDPTGTTPLTSSSTLATIDGNYVFDGAQRTAASVGAIAAQSVRFDATYTLGGSSSYDLSQGTGLLAADVTYTIFVP